MTIIPDEAAESAEARASLSAGLRALAAWLDTHPGSPLPDVHADFRIPAGPRGQRIAALEEVADWLGVPVEGDASGVLTAGRMFGPVPALGRIGRPDGGIAEFLARSTGTRGVFLTRNGAAA